MFALLKNKFSLFGFFFAVTLFCWVYSFWIFLSRQSPIISDAVSYYDHLKFYIENISRGVYPLWDFSWSCGSPNEFFLRRIGPFNPFLYLLVILNKLGVSFWPAFACFITFYFFLGMMGFYMLALEILKDARLAIVAFVLLSFSSLGTRVFDSYLMMLMTPMVWFFYFGFVFGRRGQRAALLGMVFCVMLLMTTYIPFYFLVTVLSFAIFFLLIFPKEAVGFIWRMRDIIRYYPWIFLLCCTAIILSLVPDILFFKMAGQGAFAMPLRHFDAANPHVLTVKADVTTHWAIPEDLLYSAFYLEDLRLFDFAVFYVPLFTLILFFIGMATAINRKTLFIFVWGSFLFVMGSPYLFFLYDWLHRHVFFFKYFRNLHFFLWLVILPLFILFSVEQLRLFLKMMEDNPRRKLWGLVFVFVVHAGIAAFLFWRQSFNYSTWGVVGLSLLFFTVYSCHRLSREIFVGFCFLVSVLQPLEAYYHLQHNVLRPASLTDEYNFQQDFQYTRGKKKVLSISPEGYVKSSPASIPLYFGTQWYNVLWNNIDRDILNNYMFYKFTFYDRVEVSSEQSKDLKNIEQAWVKNLDVAFVPPGTPAEVLSDPGVKGSDILTIEKGDQHLKVVDFDANGVELRTHLATRKFLVFNDCYYTGWRAYLNGKPMTLYRANVAFKGIWVPAGEHNIKLCFGEKWRYQLEIFLLVFYFIFFVIFLWFWRKDFEGKGAVNV